MPAPDDDREPPRELSTRPGDGSLPRLEAVKDERVRRWDVVTPSATVIGRTADPRHDLSERLRRLHDEQHPAMAGHSARMHRLDKARIAHALCGELDLTRWERDRVLGVMVDLDLTAFGQQRAVAKVALVVIRHVVDAERRRRLGLDDDAWVRDQEPATLEAFYERFESLTEDGRYRELLAEYGLDTTTVNRLTRTLREQLEAQGLAGAVLGRSPYRDPSLPAVRDRPAPPEEGAVGAD